MLSPQELTHRARIGAFALHAKHDPRETTSKARAVFLAKFEREVDPDGILPEAERQRRAVCARKAHFAKMALKSVRSRRRRKERTARATAQAQGAELAESAA
ncbi:MAG: hypothetical protein ACYC5J_15050 [Chloroflexota bacterium]